MLVANSQQKLNLKEKKPLTISFKKSNDFFFLIILIENEST